ncbi:hypothetical protein QN277_004086 [Acacia crassicarpa]|uniref:Nodulin-related protein 1 n=1 Tax=Acacia crassicarpa TaxID=499986 RepID=A0AAE1J107_9FABA|nr:hypothetical protein QN277_004086 [Acacia crassicarpa]
MDSDRSGRQEEHGGDGQQHAQYSTSELMAGAKVLAEAAQSGFGKDSGSIDKAKVADAAGDLLGGARQYGKLDDKGMGQYVEKAENYLHQYGDGGKSEKPSESKPEGHSESTGGGGEKPSESKPEGQSESGGGGGGGIGDYMKMAQGFLDK